MGLNKYTRKLTWRTRKIEPGGRKTRKNNNSGLRHFRIFYFEFSSFTNVILAAQIWLWNFLPLSKFSVKIFTVKQFLGKIWIFSKFSIFDQNLDFFQIFDFWPKFGFSSKFSIFGQHFYFWQNFKFLTKFSTKTSIFDKIFNQNVHFRINFLHLPKISIFEKNNNFQSKFRFENQFLTFQPKFQQKILPIIDS